MIKVDSLELAAVKFDSLNIKTEVILNGNTIPLNLDRVVKMVKENKDAKDTLEGILRSSTTENIENNFEEYVDLAIVKKWLF